MRALVCRKHGSWRDLVEADVPVPQGEGVQLRVSAAGIGFATLLAIAGRHQNRTEPPFVPGIEAAGTADGERVVALVRQGALAERVLAPSGTVWRIPDNLADADALSVAGSYAGVWMALTDRASLAPGETLLVLGAGGISGQAAIRLARLRGARVIAAARSEEGRRAARRAAADAVLVEGADLREEMLGLTAGRGADVIFDPVGGDSFAAALRVVAPEGRILVYGFASGAQAAAPTNILLVKAASVIGFYWGHYLGWARLPPTASAQARARACVEFLLGEAAAGRLALPAAESRPFGDFAAAFAAVEAGSGGTKMVLTP